MFKVLTHGQLRDQVSDEEGGRNVGELIALQIEILLHSHRTGIVVSHLVDEIHEVAEEGEWTDAPVGFAAQPAKRKVVAIGGKLCRLLDFKGTTSWL
jgi:hypothetical protein